MSNITQKKITRETFYILCRCVAAVMWVHTLFVAKGEQSADPLSLPLFGGSVLTLFTWNSDHKVRWIQRRGTLKRSISTLVFASMHL